MSPNLLAPAPAPPAPPAPPAAAAPAVGWKEPVDLLDGLRWALLLCAGTGAADDTQPVASR